MTKSEAREKILIILDELLDGTKLSVEARAELEQLLRQALGQIGGDDPAPAAPATDPADAPDPDPSEPSDTSDENAPDAPADPEEKDPAPAGPATARPTVWHECTRASCWSGKNAERRMMNILSPHMPEAKADEYIAWMKARGCNTAHVLICNERDGEFAGYCPYGREMNGLTNPGAYMHMRSRMAKIRAAGMAVIPWIFADDGPSYNRKPDSTYVRLFAECNAVGLFGEAPFISLGIELDEYFDAVRVKNLTDILRKMCGGKPIAVHQSAGRYDFAQFGDIVCLQLEPGLSPARIERDVRDCAHNTKKPVCAFELDRHENRALCEAALRGGAFSVGNW